MSNETTITLHDDKHTVTVAFAGETPVTFTTTNPAEEWVADFSAALKSEYHPVRVVREEVAR